MKGAQIPDLCNVMELDPEDDNQGRSVVHDLGKALVETMESALANAPSGVAGISGPVGSGMKAVLPPPEEQKENARHFERELQG